MSACSASCRASSWVHRSLANSLFLFLLYLSFVGRWIIFVVVVSPEGSSSTKLTSLAHGSLTGLAGWLSHLFGHFRLRLQLDLPLDLPALLHQRPHLARLLLVQALELINLLALDRSQHALPTNALSSIQHDLDFANRLKINSLIH